MIDGDTIEVARPAGVADVRLIGVDTPETVHPTEPIECYGPRASSFTHTQLEGERVRLEYDAERRDQYGRVLAYIWFQGRLFNRVLVARGYAEVMIYEPNDARADTLYAAETGARSHDRGLWGACSGSDGSAGAPVAAPPPSNSGGRCDSNYEGACIPSYPPDLDCPDTGATNFSSVGSDPHGFDGDSDGVACES